MEQNKPLSKQDRMVNLLPLVSLVVIALAGIVVTIW